MSEGNRSRSRLLPSLLGLLILLLGLLILLSGLALLAGGIKLASLGGSLYYGVHVTDWLTVRPNLQYIKQPGGVDEVDNALVAGIKIQTVF